MEDGMFYEMSMIQMEARSVRANQPDLIVDTLCSTRLEEILRRGYTQSIRCNFREECGEECHGWPSLPPFGYIPFSLAVIIDRVSNGPKKRDF